MIENISLTQWNEWDQLTKAFEENRFLNQQILEINPLFFGVVWQFSPFQIEFNCCYCGDLLLRIPKEFTPEMELVLLEHADIHKKLCTNLKLILEEN